MEEEEEEVEEEEEQGCCCLRQLYTDCIKRAGKSVHPRPPSRVTVF